MNWLINLNTRAKLLLIFGIALALFTEAIATAYRAIDELLQAQGDSRDKQSNVADLSRIDANLNEARVGTLMLFLSANREETDNWVARIRDASADSRRIFTELRARNKNAPDILEQLNSYEQTGQIYRDTRDKVVQLVLDGKLQEARSISLADQNRRFLELHEMAEQMVKAGLNDSAVALAHSRETANNARKIFLIVGIGAIVLSLGMVIWLSRMITQPLDSLVAAAKRVEGGDLSVKIEHGDRQDELGALARSFQSMVASFRTMHREVQEGVSVLATSASEIFTATAEIAASATETATAVSQTTTTVEEVKQTAELSAQKAGYVADVAQKAAQASQTGRRSVDESIGGMQHIREQMELIADTVVRLSEQSQAIGEIIASVNELAEQSNLLAVNASIEAAKAGEHGRGFAVVAQEIRSLATQSKESTAQVRGILNDIQKATTAAVMAAEQGSKAVDAGVKQVNQSGDSIRALAESIVTASQAATQITASSQQQLIGVDQVATAIQSIYQASKQNATGTQQAEAGARNLNELGQKLKKIVQRFTV